MSIALISLIVAICSALGTLFHWLYSWNANRKSYSIKVVRAAFYNSKLLMLVVFENKSKQPISFTQFALLLSGDKVFPSFTEEKLFERTRRRGGEIISVKETKSLGFPINLSGYCSCSGYLQFGMSQSTALLSSNTLSAEVCTNRGKPDRIELLLSEVVPLENMIQQ